MPTEDELLELMREAEKSDDIELIVMTLMLVSRVVEQKEKKSE